MPCGANEPVPLSELKLRPPRSSEEMWVFPGFVAFLEDGRILVPVEKVDDCSKIRGDMNEKKAQTSKETIET